VGIDETIAEVQQMLDRGELRLAEQLPIVTRCKCGRPISKTRIYCLPCRDAELARRKALKA
jgi:hypothetical protein